jgi:intracellular sulfur oxidation DsrE/DsrF family protein
MSLGMENLSFAACGNTMAKMAKKEGNDIPIMSEAKQVTSGVVRLIELQEAGYSYLRP